MNIKNLIINMCCVCISCAIAKDIQGIYLTHKGTQGGQSIVEIFNYDGKYHIYGLKNLENNPKQDTCNKNKDLKDRYSVGNVFAYDYQENEKGEFTGGMIYNYNDCKTYYGKITPTDDGIKFTGALDSYYILSASYQWKKLNEEEAKEYMQYRKDIDYLAKSIQDTRRSK